MAHDKDARAVSRREAAKILGVSVPTLDRRLYDGSLASVRVGGRRLIPLSAIEDALRPRAPVLSEQERAREALCDQATIAIADVDDARTRKALELLLALIEGPEKGT